jgi:sulfonate transport system substrate-binding protein
MSFAPTSFAKMWSRAGLAVAMVLIPVLGGLATTAQAADKVDEVKIDFAYYNPVSLVLKDKGWLEDALRADGIKVRWVQSLGSNKALEFLNAKGLDFGSTAGAAALLARINGNPVKSIYVTSKPEWTALVTQGGSAITKVADLRGKRVAATRGTDPHIFLIRTLAASGLTEKDVKIVLLQHQDGRTALAKGDVDAWAGLDPLMAQAELEDGARLFYRNADINTWGVLNTRDDFAADHPELVLTVLRAYEKARAFAIANPDELKRIIADKAKLTDAVAARQLERTDLSTAAIGDRQRQTIEGAGIALQQAGVIPPEVDVAAVTAQLVDPSFVTKLGVK